MAALFDLAAERMNELRRWQCLFERDGNKAAAWRCFRLARAWDLPIPDSVLAELDRIAAAFDETIEQVRETQADGHRKAAIKGLSIERAGRIITEAGPGSTDPAVGLLAWERDFLIASAVQGLRLGGWTEAAAVERVSEGTEDLAYRTRVEEDIVIFGPAPTPPRSSELVRRAVRRVKALAADTTETPDLREATD